MISAHPLNLSEFRFTASIDYVTLSGVQKASLPLLHGKAKWPKSAPHRLTVQEPAVSEIEALIDAFPAGRIYELEICVDVRVAKMISPEFRDEALKTFKAEFVTKRLRPTFTAGTNSGFRGAYDPILKKTVPYNYRVPSAFQQLLMGHRNDGAQVKCYYKRTDNGKRLPDEKHSIRVEVRLNMVGLDRHALASVDDLIGFKFRKELMPYFTHVCGTRRRLVRKTRRTPLLVLLLDKQDAFDKPHWDRVGVGAFLPGGKRRQPALVFKHDIALNNRIGQALGRLERSFSVENFVRLR